MIAIESIACAFPAKSLGNDELRAAYPNWDFERLAQRTGVARRYVAQAGETALDFALEACRQLAADGRFPADEIGAVVFCTQTPDYVMPPNSCLLHGALDLRTDALAFDITLACSGYVYGLQIAAGLMASGAASKVLLATADTYTRYIHPGDRATRCLFGDGGAVTILGSSDEGCRIRAIQCGTAGKHYEKFIIRAGGMRSPRSAETARESVDASGNVRTPEHIHMDGMGVLSFFNSTVPCAVRRILAEQGLELGDIDLFIFHQASRIALDSIRFALAIPEDRMVYDFADTGNLVSASIPVALSRALDSGRVRPGDRLLLCGFGVGLSWGTAVIEV